MPSAEAAVARFARRYGIKLAIVASGVAVVAGTLHKATYVSRTPLAQRIVAAAPMNVKTPWGTSPSADSSIAPGGLDAGVDHARIAFWVNRLSTTLRAEFSRTLGRKEKYDGMIESKLAAKKMPKDLVYLAMIESEFNPNARSPVKALGLWQFMSSTARQLGLVVHGHVDQRRDPARATDAALTYLSGLHDRLGSWYLAAAAYNAGEGTVVKALRTATGRSTGTDDDFFRILPLLPRETQDYVPKLIAAARIGDAPSRYGLTIPDATADGEVVTPAAAVPKGHLREPKRATANAKFNPTSKTRRTAKAGKSRHVVNTGSRPKSATAHRRRTR